VEATVADQRADGVTVVRLRGQLDIDTSHRLREVLESVLDQPVPRVVVDVSGLTFCDSIGLSALVLAYNRCTEQGGFLRLSGPTPFLVRMLSVVGLMPALSVYTNLPDACAGNPAGLVAPLPRHAL
jgi:anti-sigma B factor antagonist